VSRRGKIWLAVGFGLFVAAVAHYLYWYAPRERPAAPAPTGLAARVLASRELPLAAWIPSPHQNLGLAEEAVADLETWLDAGCRLAGLAAPRLPAFGPFRFPPASELVLAGSPDGARLVVVAEVYPVAALFARLAGKLAGNPWLAGGEVTFRNRPARVEWRGSAWVVRIGELPEVPERGPELAPALAWARVELADSPVPAGTYRLLRQPEGLVLRLAESGTSAALPRLASMPDPPALFLVRARSATRGGAQGLALWRGGSGNLGLPAAAVFAAAPATRWRLPAEGLLGLAGREVKTLEAGPWTFAAYERADRVRAVEWLRAALGSEPETTPVVGGRSLLWLQPTALVGLSRQVSGVVQHVPLLGREDLERWQDLATFLTPLGPCAWVAGELRHDPPLVDLMLCPTAAPAD
jgi:hypothetical protein